MILNRIKAEITEKINKALNQKLVKASDLVYPPQTNMGDISLPCFSLAKELGENPTKAAQRLVGKISAKGIIASTNSAGPYFNIKLKTEVLAEELIKIINKEKEKFGFNKSGRKKRVLIEFTNVNTHKEYHVGHLRNLCYGDATARILAANGYTSIPVSYINDFGIHVAKTLWAYLEFYQKKELPNNKGKFLGEVYARSNKEAKKDQTAKQMIELIMRRIESRQGDEYKLWQETREWSIEQFAKIYQEMNVSLDHTYYESEFIDEGRKKVIELLKQGILKQSQGAVIADLEEYGLGVLVVLRSDGTATYPVADIPLAIAKMEKYKFDKSLYVVDVRQSLYFKQLFKILSLMGYQGQLIHLGFNFVKLPMGMMSSRSGNIISYEDLREQMFIKAKEETAKRHSDWSDKKIISVSNVLTTSAIRFEMIKTGALQEIIFDTEKALHFQGFTAAYIQYTYARLQSILKKAGKINPRNIDLSKLKEQKEHALLLSLAKYQEVVKRAGKKYDASEIAKYVYDLAQQLNDYYHNQPILKAEEKIKICRLKLILSASQVIKNALDLLGIKVVDEM